MALEPVEPARAKVRRQRGTIEYVGTHLMIFLFVVVAAATVLAMIESRAASPITFAPVTTAPSTIGGPSAAPSTVPAPVHH